MLQRFVPNFAGIAALLNIKLPEDQPTHLEKLDEDEILIQQTLQQKLITPPVLALPGSTSTYPLDSDACNRQIGWVLLQQQPEPDKPNGYCSKSLNDANPAYDTVHKDCLAIFCAVSLQRSYLGGTRLKI